MGLFSSPKIRQPSQAELQLAQRGAELQRLSKQFRPAGDRYLRDLIDPSDEIRTARGMLNADVHQGFRNVTDMPRRLTDAAIARGEALSRGSTQTRSGIHGQRLEGLSRAYAGGLGDLETSIRGDRTMLGLETSNARARQRARGIKDAALGNLIGTVVGGVGAYYDNKKQPPPKSQGQYSPAPQGGYVDLTDYFRTNLYPGGG